MRFPWIVGITGALLFGAMLGYAGALFISRSEAASRSLSSPSHASSLDVPRVSDNAEGIAGTTGPEDACDEQAIILADELALPRDIVVAVTGAVRRPGVYRFDESARVKGGILEAGGATADADLDDINLAAKLIDNTTLHIPLQSIREHDRHAIVARRSISAAESNPAQYTRSGWAHGDPRGAQQLKEKDIGVPGPSVPGPMAKGGAVNLNTASLEELQQLPGIGPKTAEKIIAYRQSHPFRAIDELAEVHGIGPKKLEAVRSLITVD